MLSDRAETLTASYFHHLVVKRRIYNLFAPSHHVGITNYIDVGPQPVPLPVPSVGFIGVAFLWESFHGAPRAVRMAGIRGPGRATVRPSRVRGASRKRNDLVVPKGGGDCPLVLVPASSPLHLATRSDS